MNPAIRSSTNLLTNFSYSKSMIGRLSYAINADLIKTWLVKKDWSQLLNY